MDPKLNKKESSSVQSLCSCPSCDSLECFSVRYNSGRKECSCNKCSLTSCLYMPKTKSTSIHKIIHGGSTKFHIHDDDIATIEESIRKDIAYGAIKDKIYKDGKGRVIMRKVSTKAQSKTQLKESLSTDIRNPDVKNIPSCSKSRGLLEKSVSSCKNLASNVTCKSDCELNKNSKLTSGTSSNVVEQNEDTKDISSTTNNKAREHNSEYDHLPKKAYKVYREVTTTTQTTTTVKKPAITTYDPDTEKDKIPNGFVSSSCTKRGSIQEKINVGKGVQSITVHGALTDALNPNTKETEKTNKFSKCAARVKEFKALPSKEYMESLKKKKEFKDLLARKLCKMNPKGSNLASSSTICGAVTDQIKNSKYIPSKTYKVDISESKNFSPSIKSNAAQNKNITDFLNPISCETCGGQPEKMRQTKSFSTKLYKVITSDIKQNKNLPTNKTYHTIKGENHDTNGLLVPEENKNNTDYPSNTTCEAMLDDRQNTKSYATKLFPFNEGKSKDDKNLSFCTISHEEQRDTNDHCIGNKNIWESLSCTICPAVLHDKNDFGFKLHTIVKEDQKKNVHKSSLGEENENNCEPPPYTMHVEEKDKIKNNEDLSSYTIQDEKRDATKKQKQQTKKTPQCAVCKAILEQIKDNKDFPSKSYRVVKEDNIDAKNIPSHTTHEAVKKYKDSIHFLIEEHSEKTLKSLSCTTNKAALEDSLKVIQKENKDRKKQHLNENTNDCLVKEENTNTEESIIIIKETIEDKRGPSPNSIKVNREKTDDNKEKSHDSLIRDQNENPFCPTCGTVLDQMKKSDNLPPESYAMVQEEYEYDQDFQSFHHSTQEVIRKQNQDTDDSSIAKPNENPKESPCTVNGAVLEQNKVSKNIPITRISMKEDEQTTNKFQTGEKIKKSFTTSQTALEPVQKQKNQPNNFSTEGQNKIINETQESKQVENDLHDFSHKSYSVIQTKDKNINDITSNNGQEENKEVYESLVGEQRNYTSEVLLSTASGGALEQTPDTKGVLSNSNKEVSSNKDIPSSTTCESVLKQKLNSSKNHTSSSACKLVIEQTFSTGTNGVPSTCKAIVKHTHSTDAKDSTSSTTCTTVLKQVITSGTNKNSNKSIKKHTKGLGESPFGTKKPENDIEEPNDLQPGKSTVGVRSDQNHAMSNKIPSFGAKCDAVKQRKETSDNRSEKLLNKQDIYNRIIEAYQNCNCQVCECIVTLNETSTPKSSETCCCKPCERLKDIALTDTAYTNKQSRVRLTAVTDSKDFCSCKPCDCVVCKSLTERYCNCTPCECIQCLGLLYKNETNTEETKECNCTPCQCEDCLTETAYPESVDTHEMSTGPDDVKQQCNCALCSYHFFGNEVTNLENESCECEAQNKFMRKPNARCYHDYDIRTVSVDVCNNKAKLSKSKIPLPKRITSSRPLDKIMLNKTQRSTTSPECTERYIVKKLCNTSYDETESDTSGKVGSPESSNTDDRYWDPSKNISDHDAISLEDETMLRLEATAKVIKESVQNTNDTISTNSEIYRTKSSESVDIQNGTRIRPTKSNSSVSQQRLSQPKIACDGKLVPTKEHNISSKQNYQIYNIKHHTIKHNSSKLTASSRNISIGSSKLVQTIIYEICHEIVENIFMQATKDLIVKLELGQKFKSITVLKDIKTKTGEVNFSELSIQIVPTDDKIEAELPKTVGNPHTQHPMPHKNQNEPQLNEDAPQESTPKTNEELFRQNEPKKNPDGPTFDCNFCIIDESFGTMLNCDKYSDKGQIKENSKTCDFEFDGSQYFRYPTVSHATKISRPHFPLKHRWINTKSWLDNGSQISIHDSNNFEYYNNIFELQVYNIRLENTLKKAKTFSMELMKMLHKFEKANKNFKSLSKKMHPIPSELQEDSDEEESTSKKVENNLLSLQHKKRCLSPIKKIKTCFKCKSTKESKYDEENNQSSNTLDNKPTDRGQLVCDGSCSECILYDERLDKKNSSPYSMKCKEPEVKANTGLIDNSEVESRFNNGLRLKTDETSGLFRTPIGQHDTEDNIGENTSYEVLVSRQEDKCSRKWPNMRKNFYLTDAKPTTKSIGISVRPISMAELTDDDIMKSVIVQTNPWDRNKKNTYENRALAKLKMEVTQLSNMPFLQPNVWCNSYDDCTSDSKSDLDDFSNIPLKQRPTYKENMWDTLLEDIDCSYTLPPKRKIDEKRHFDYNMKIKENEYRGSPKLEGHTFIHPRTHNTENLGIKVKPKNLNNDYINLSLSKASLASKGLIDEETSYSQKTIDQRQSRCPDTSKKLEVPVRYMTPSKKVEYLHIPYSPKDQLSGHDVDDSKYIEPQKTFAPKEDVYKEINRYKDFLKDLQLKGPKDKPQPKKTLDCKHSSCNALKVGMVAVRRVSNHTAIVKWTAPKIVACILGYEILIDGRGVQKILNPTCRMCVVTCLPYTDAVLVTIRTLTSTLAEHSPTSTVVYRPRVK